MAIEWNEEQRGVLDCGGANIMVSASAGSGKTAVMLERIMNLCASTPAERLAVLAFNDDIAAEIKEKLSNRFAAAAEETGDPFWIEQLDSLPFCSVSTFHKFCSGIVREYFEVAGVDASFSVMDEKERDAVFNKSIREVLDEYYEASDPDFARFNSVIGKREEVAAGYVKKIYDFAAAQMDRDGWMEKTALRPFAAENDNALIKKFLQIKREEACRLLALGEEVSVWLRRDAEEKAALASGATGKKQAASAALAALRFEELKAFYEKFLKGCAEAKAFSEYRSEGAGSPPYNGNHFKFKSEIKPKLSDYMNSAKELYENADYYTYAEASEFLEQGGRFAKVLLSIVKRVSAVFSEAKRKENKLDFDDLEYYAVKVLKNEEIRDKIREKYDFVYVDEYQDTNRVQEFIINSVSVENNLFTVGDSKQSIYRFRLSEPEILIGRRRAYKQEGKGRAFSLNYNYRSDERILTFVNDVFSVLMTEDFGGENYAEEAMFKAGKKYGEVNGLPAVEVAFYKRGKTEKGQKGVYSVKNHKNPENGVDEAYTEALYAAEKIRAVMDQGVYDPDTGLARKAQYSDVAILAAKRSPKVSRVLRYLKQFGIPVEAEPLSGREKCFEIEILIDLLRVVDNPRQDIPLAAAMKAFGGLDDCDLLETRKSAPRKKFFYECAEQAAKQFEVRTKCYSDEEKLAAADAMTSGFGEKCAAFYQRLAKWRKMSAFLSVSELLEYAVEETGFALRLQSEEGGAGKYARLRQYLASLKGKSYAKSVAEFLYACDKLELKNELTAPAESERDCVKTSTVHHSKGLEFPVVLLIDAAASPKPDASNLVADAEEGLAMSYFDTDSRRYYRTPQTEILRAKNKKAEAEERLRLLYVALTRAKNHLFVIGSVPADKKEPRFPEEASTFAEWLSFAAARSKAGEAVKYIDAEALKLCESAADFAFGDPDEETFVAAKKYVEFRYPYEESTKLSIKHTATEINKQDERVDVYVPHLFTESTAERGSVYHKILERIDYSARTAEDVAAQISELIEAGEIDARAAEGVSAEMIAECLSSSVIEYARAHRHRREASFMLYLPADEVMDVGVSDKILVQGTIDLLIFDGEGGGAVVDFKSSGLPSETLKKTYARQLSIYKKAAEICFGLKNVQAYLYVLGRNELIKTE